MEQIFVTRPSQVKAGHFDVFNTAKNEVYSTHDLEGRAEWMAKDLNRKIHRDRIEQETKTKVEDNIIAVLKNEGETIAIREWDDMRGHARRSISVLEPISGKYVGLNICRMDMPGNIFRIDSYSVRKSHTRSKADGSISAGKLIDLVAMAKSAEAAYYRRCQAHRASNDGVKQVVESTNGWMTDDSGHLPELGMSVRVSTAKYGTNVSLKIEGEMTAERAAAIIAALREFKVGTEA